MGTMVKVDGRSLTQVRRKLHDMRRRADNLTAAWEVLLDWFAHQERLQFGTRGTRWGTPWRELAPVTVHEKRELGYTTDILVRDSTLLRSLADRPLRIERILPHEVTAGTNVPYAHFHQSGTKYMPRRELISAEAVAREGVVTQAVISWILRGRSEVRE